jgi:hypothetical protein
MSSLICCCGLVVAALEVRCAPLGPPAIDALTTLSRVTNCRILNVMSETLHLDCIPWSTIKLIDFEKKVNYFAALPDFAHLAQT